jgi:hypothetical protein
MWYPKGVSNIMPNESLSNFFSSILLVKIQLQNHKNIELFNKEHQCVNKQTDNPQQITN